MIIATPFLMFQGDAAPALDFYVATIPGSRIDTIDLFDEEGPGKPGWVRMAQATIAGLAVLVNDSPIAHAFSFTPSLSMILDCADEAEFDHLIAALGEGGEWLMPPDNYGFCAKFAWLNDRFGVSWQVRLA